MQFQDHTSINSPVISQILKKPNLVKSLSSLVMVLNLSGLDHELRCG